MASERNVVTIPIKHIYESLSFPKCCVDDCDLSFKENESFQLPDYIWSEEYQDSLLSRHFECFDQLRSEGFFIGEMIWNFADFKTAQSTFKLHT